MASQILGIGVASTELSQFERRLLRERPPGGIVLFSRNIASVEQLRRLVDDIRREASAPVLLMVDAEGGRVDRFRSLLPGLPGAYRFRQAEDGARLANEAGALTGAILRFFDIDVDLAPVVDVERPLPAPGLERRCFGSDAETVTRLAGAFLDGLHASGVAGCLKHFPGIGAQTGDPHYGAAAINVSREELERVDLEPYRQLADRCGAVMIGHGSYGDLPDSGCPASLNVTITRQLLRRDVGFTGVVISDDMEMHAVSDRAPLEETAEQALTAGNDLVLFCARTEEMPELCETLDERVADDAALQSRVADAQERIARYRDQIEHLRRESDRYELPEIESWLESFRSRMDEQAPEAETFESRTSGTGVTGREEWT